MDTININIAVPFVPCAPAPKLKRGGAFWLRWEAQVFLPAMADAQKAVAVAAHVGGRVSAHVTLEVTEAFPAAMRQMPTTLSGQRWS